MVSISPFLKKNSKLTTVYIIILLKQYNNILLLLFGLMIVYEINNYRAYARAISPAPL